MSSLPPPIEMPVKLWSVDELAQFLGVPKQTIYAQRAKGVGVRGIRVGKHLRFRPEDVFAYLERQADDPTEPSNRSRPAPLRSPAARRVPAPQNQQKEPA